MRRFWRESRQQWLDRRIPPAERIRLRQRQVFILPTRAGAVFLGTLVLLLLVAINYQNSLVFGLVFLLAAIFAVSLLHTWRNLVGLQLWRAESEAAFAEQTAYFAVELVGGGRAHRQIRINQLPPVSVAAKQRDCVRIPTSSSQRGLLRAGRLHVSSDYPLGLIRAWSWVDLQQQVYIYPQPAAQGAAIGSVGAGSHVSEQESTQRGVDDFQGLTRWQAGESLSRIDWRAFSRGQGLMNKQFAQGSGGEAVLDIATATGNLEERIAALCRSVLTLSATDQSFTLRLGTHVLGPAYGARHKQCCLEALATYGDGAHSHG